MAPQQIQGHWNPEFARVLRRAYLDLTLRRARPGTGSSWQFVHQRHWSELQMDFSQIQTPFVVIGAVATRLYMPERHTREVDLLVETRSREAIAKELNSFGFTLQDQLPVGGSTWFSEVDGEVDVLESDAPWVAGAIAQPERAPDGTAVIALPFLVLLKLNASRGIDIGDLTKLLGLADEAARERVRSVVREFQPEDSDDLESLILLGDLEFGAERLANQ